MEGTEPQANKLLSSENGLSFGRAVSSADTSSSNGQAAVAATGRVEKKMFVGRVPVEATAEDLHAYFSQFGLVLDVYLPKVKTSLQSMSRVNYSCCIVCIGKYGTHILRVTRYAISFSLFFSHRMQRRYLTEGLALSHLQMKLQLDVLLGLDIIFLVVR